MRATRIVVMFAAALALASSTRSSAADERARDVSATLETIRAKHDVPGLVALTLAGDRVVAQGAAGVRRRGGADAITVDDKMHLGSCTKAMTATLCAVLVQEKKLRWDERPAETFAKDVTAIDAGWKTATLDMLLRNHAGAPTSMDADGLWSRLWAHAGTPRAARTALVVGVLGRAPVAPPGSKYEYSNAGFSIAGAMAEKALDASYEDAMRERLFKPLAMTSAGFGAPIAALVVSEPPGTTDAPGATAAPVRPKVSQPRGHRADGTPVDPGPGDDNPVAIAPAGRVHASLPDWAKFISLHLRRGEGTEGPLGAIDFAKLHAPSGGAQPGSDYAMGWQVAERPWAKGATPGDRGRVLTHAGSNSMWYCVAWLAPERGFAVLAATNQGGDAAAKACDAAAGALIREHVAATAK